MECLGRDYIHWFRVAPPRSLNYCLHNVAFVARVCLGSWNQWYCLVSFVKISMGTAMVTAVTSVKVGDDDVSKVSFYLLCL